MYSQYMDRYLRVYMYINYLYQIYIQESLVIISMQALKNMAMLQNSRSIRRDEAKSHGLQQ